MGMQICLATVGDHLNIGADQIRAHELGRLLSLRDNLRVDFEDLESFWLFHDPFKLILSAARSYHFRPGKAQGFRPAVPHTTKRKSSNVST